MGVCRSSQQQQVKLFMGKGERISRWVQSQSDKAESSSSGDEIARNEFYGAFFRCWNEQQYYEAHDVLEHLWLRTKSDDASYFKGLIQAAGAFVHLKKQFEFPGHAKHGRRLAPAQRLLRLALKNLEPFRPMRHAFDVSEFCALLTATDRALEKSACQKNPWSPEMAPKLSLRPGKD